MVAANTLPRASLRQQLDLAAVRLSDPARDRQAETGAAFATGRVEAHEPLEDALAILGRNAGAAVG